MGKRVRAFDWGATSLGPLSGWPAALRVTVDQMLASSFPACLFWGPDLIAIYNDGYKPILGLKPEALGMPFRDIWPEAWEQLEPIAAKALAGESTFIENHPLRTDRRGVMEDAWFTFNYGPVFDEHGKVVGMLDTVVETTHQMLARQRDMAERDVLASIVQTTDVFIQVLDLDFRILAINDANARESERLYGFRPSVGDSLPALMEAVPAHRDQVMALWRRAMSGESFVAQGEFGVQDRGPRVYEIKFEVLRSPEGEQIGAFHISTDVTDRLREQRELAETQEALRQSQKMEAIGQLTGGIAHDFNNLLAAISSSFQVIKMRVQTGQLNDLGRYLDIGERSVRRAAALTQRLLAFSRRQALDPRPTNANRLVQGMADLVERTVGPSVHVVLEQAPELWQTRVDAPQLENALLNLCINARDAMPSGGTITVRTRNVTLDARLAAECKTQAGDHVCISVIDVGTGMPPEMLRRVFDPFFTTKPLGQGTGLGLSMVHGFVHQSGGCIQVESTLGRGTTVNLYLPRYIGMAAVADAGTAAAASETTHGAGRGETVLLVEDEDALRDIAREMLEEAGYRVLTAANAGDGLRMLQSTEHIDLLVSDVGLPGGMNGRQMADVGRVSRPELKVLFITGYADVSAVGVNGLLDKGLSLMSKPFDLGDLIRRVREMIG